MWSKAQGQRSSGSGVLCSLSDNLGVLGRNLFGGGFVSCGRSASDYGSDYGSDNEEAGSPKRSAVMHRRGGRKACAQGARRFTAWAAWTPTAPSRALRATFGPRRS